MQVIKRSGEFEKFNPKKIYYSVREAGGSKFLAKEAMHRIRLFYHKNVTTDEILDILLKFLKKEPGVSERYDMKRAIMSLGPSGFPFETFLMLLNHDTSPKGFRFGFQINRIIQLIAQYILELVSLVEIEMVQMESLVVFLS